MNVCMYVYVSTYFCVHVHLMLLYVHRDRTDCLGRGAQDVHLDFHTAPDICVSVHMHTCACACVCVSGGGGGRGAGVL